MNRARHLSFALVLTLSIPPARAQPARQCMTPEQFRSIVIWAVPRVVPQVAERCAATLSETAYLRRGGGAELVDRYRAPAAAAWPAVRGYVTAQIEPLMRGLIGDKMLRTLAEGYVAKEADKPIAPATCSYIDRALDALAPLPVANAGQLIVVLGEMIATDKKRRIDICPAEPMPRDAAPRMTSHAAQDGPRP